MTGPTLTIVRLFHVVPYAVRWSRAVLMLHRNFNRLAPIIKYHTVVILHDIRYTASAHSISLQDLLHRYSSSRVWEWSPL